MIIGALHVEGGGRRVSPKRWPHEKDSTGTGGSEGGGRTCEPRKDGTSRSWKRQGNTLARILQTDAALLTPIFSSERPISDF